MRKLSYFGIFVFTLLGVSVFAFWGRIQEIRALSAYSALFDPDEIDENFRSLYLKYPSITVGRAGPVYDLPVALRTDALPTGFAFEGEVIPTNDFLERTHTTGMAVMSEGAIVYEMYDRGNRPESQAIMMSVSKSVASILFGVAVDDELIDDLDDPVTKYVPELAGTAYDGVAIRNVLEMSSGVRWNEDYGDLQSDIVRSLVAVLLGSLDEFTATLPRELEPGAFNRYASIDTHVLGMVLRRVTGSSYEDYFRDKLWSKIGVEGPAEILVDSVGQPVVFGGLNIRLRDMIRIGKLLADDGRNHLGERIVSRDWIRLSTTPDAPRLMPGRDNPASDNPLGYKFQWWLPLSPDGGDFVAVGIYGQFIYVNPLRQVVIAKTSAYPDYLVDGTEMELRTVAMFQAIARHLVP